MNLRNNKQLNLVKLRTNEASELGIWVRQQCIEKGDLQVDSDHDGYDDGDGEQAITRLLATTVVTSEGRRAVASVTTRMMAARARNKMTATMIIRMEPTRATTWTATGV
ncbi:uncharacterized protein LOC115927908 [Strongylocentrotus purpuratus]|uniref:Uncharacterized protein n=1 Tax=Strongylocentrotus purpuratus TaxID=7668 RepID=A0A7M7T2Z5_STRPU|nr:uncharacterized protein LOC115927908 [Strongylocentrotus purpuratus]